MDEFKLMKSLWALMVCNNNDVRVAQFSSLVHSRTPFLLKSLHDLQTCSSEPVHTALFADLDWVPISASMWEALLYVCLSVQPSHLFKQRSFHLRLGAGWAFFFLFPFFFPGTFSVILGPDCEGHGSASFVRAPLWKEAVLPNVISGTGRVHFGLWKKTIGSGHV